MPRKELDARAKSLFNKLVKRLNDPTEIQLEILSILCDSVSRYWQCSEIVKEGFTVPHGKDSCRKHPAIDIMKAAADCVRANAKLLGLDKKQEESDTEIEDILGG